MLGVPRMHILVCLDSDPGRSLPVWAAFTDAHEAVLGLEITVMGSPDIIRCIKAHPAVTGEVPVDMPMVDVPMVDVLRDRIRHLLSRWHPSSWAARRAIKSACDALPSLPDIMIDPFGTPETRALTHLVSSQLASVLRVGMADLANPRRDKDYSSVFPIPAGLHVLQTIRIVFAAVLNYSIHDLAPNYGLLNEPVHKDVSEDHANADLIVDGASLPWDAVQIQQFKERIAETPLTVHYLDESTDLNAAQRLLNNWPSIMTANYLLAGLSANAWLAAALGRPGLCLCPENKASESGVISTRWATQQIINLDHPPFNEPNIVVESIIQVLSRQSASLSDQS